MFLLQISCNKSSNINKDHLVFRYNEHKNIGSLDPAFAKDNADIWAVNQLFNGLVQMDENLNVKPCIAKKWTVSENALHYSFVLRDDVKFHKHELFGPDSIRIVNAKDFEYSFNRLLDKNLASPGSWVLKNVSNFEAISDSIFEINLMRPFPAFLGILTMKYCSVVPKEIVEYYKGDIRSNPIGTGPFKFKRWEENIKLVFRKNRDYFEKDKNGKQLPYLEAVAVTFLPDKQSEFLQFVQNNIDFVSGLDASYKDEILTAKGTLRDRYSMDVNMIRGPYLNTEYLAFYLDTELPEIQSELIRKAVNYGFDRQNMMLYLRNGIGIPANGGFIPRGLGGFNSKIGFEYNPEKAKNYIEKFKSTSGIKNPQIKITTTNNYLSFCEYIQRELQKIGLNVIIDVMPASTLKEAKANGKLDLFRASWVADYPDAENYLSLFYSQNFAPQGPNYSHYNNDLYDDLYERSLSETNRVEREKLYSQMDSIAMSNAPVVPLFYDEVVRFTRKSVNGLGINPINLLDLKKVRKNKN